MRFSDTSISGVMLIDTDPVRDPRGFFARTWDWDEFLAHGLRDPFVQWSISRNERRGTLRGLHFQLPPFAESKLVRCRRGAIFDVVVDLRKDSATFRRWFSVELSAGNLRSLWVPPGCAHGFQALDDDSEVEYAISAVYDAAHARGVRWNDDALGILWPDVEVRTMSERDRSLPNVSQVESELPDSWENR